MPFNCHYCTKVFISEFSRGEHELIHAGARISCELCGRSYSNFTNLNRHVRNDHSEKASGEKASGKKATNTLSIHHRSAQTAYSYPDGYLRCGICYKIFRDEEMDGYYSHTSECIRATEKHLTPTKYRARFD